MRVPIGLFGTVVGLLLSVGSASAVAPQVQTVSGDFAIVLAGADSPCEFPIEFRNVGSATVKTFFDRQGRPIRQLITNPNSLVHVLTGLTPGGRSLTARGPAPAHIDLATGIQTSTGAQYVFHVTGHGVVLGAAGHYLFAPGGITISSSGLDRLDANTLCAALAPAA